MLNVKILSFHLDFDVVVLAVLEKCVRKMVFLGRCLSTYPIFGPLINMLPFCSEPQRYIMSHKMHIIHMFMICYDSLHLELIFIIYLLITSYIMC